MEKEIKKALEEINLKLDKIQVQNKLISIRTKDVFNFYEACIFLELSNSHLYKMTSSKQIPYYKPTGKKLYFKRTELIEWLLRNKSEPTNKESLQVEPIGNSEQFKKSKVNLKFISKKDTKVLNLQDIQRKKIISKILDRK